MPRDFNTFVRDQQNEQKNEQKPSDDKVQEYKDIIDKYKDLNSNELMTTLLGEASKLKSEGKLDSSMLDGLRSTLSPFLNDEQKTTLNGLISAINEQK